MDEVDPDDVEVVYSKEVLANSKNEVLEVKSNVESHPGEGMLIKNPKSSVKTEDVKHWRYMYRIPLSVEIRVPTTHERVDRVVPD